MNALNSDGRPVIGSRWNINSRPAAIFEVIEPDDSTLESQVHIRVIEGAGMWTEGSRYKENAANFTKSFSNGVAPGEVKTKFTSIPIPAEYYPSWNILEKRFASKLMALDFAGRL